MEKPVVLEGAANRGLFVVRGVYEETREIKGTGYAFVVSSISIQGCTLGVRGGAPAGINVGDLVSVQGRIEMQGKRMVLAPTSWARG